MIESSWVGKPSRALLASNEEDRFTNYLMELLLAPDVPKAFLRSRTELDLQEVDVHSLMPETQVTVPGGRADLVITGPDTLLIFESKVGAWLHGNQLRTYEAFLKDWLADRPDGIAKLYLIAPESQLPRLTEAATEEESDFSWKGISWEEIGRLFSELANDVDSARLRTHLRDFDDLVSYRLGDMARPYTEEEVLLLGDRLVGVAFMRLQAVIEATVKEIRSTFGSKLKSNQGNGMLFSGYWLYYGDRSYWLSLWIPAYARLGISPLFFQVYDSLPFGIETPSGMGKPINQDLLTGVIFPLIIQPNLAPEELGRIYASQIAALIEEVARMEAIKE